MGYFIVPLNGLIEGLELNNVSNRREEFMLNHWGIMRYLDYSRLDVVTSA